MFGTQKNLDLLGTTRMNKVEAMPEVPQTERSVVLLRRHSPIIVMSMKETSRRDLKLGEGDSRRSNRSRSAFQEREG